MIALARIRSSTSLLRALPARGAVSSFSSSAVNYSGSNVLTDDTFQEHVLASKGPAIVDFYADWCGPCRVLYPKLQKAVSESTTKVALYKLSVDDSPKVSEQFQVSSIPLVVGFRDGKEVARFVGVQKEDFLKNFINAVTEGNK